MKLHAAHQSQAALRITRHVVNRASAVGFH